jgi:hypothetical protein
MIEPDNNPTLLTTQQIQNYVNATHKSPCPSCGEGVWSVITPPPNVAPYLMFYPSKRLENGRIYPEATPLVSVYALVAISCAACGLVHTYSYDKIEKWTAELS